MPDDIQINPAPGVVPAAPEAPPAEGAELPDEVLQQPVFQALMAGSPPAASAQLANADKTPFGQLVAKNGAALQSAGFGFYRSQDGNVGAIFNQLYVNPEQIQQADQQGKLSQIAPPVDQIEQAMAADPAKNPVLSAKATPAVAAQPGIPGGAAGSTAPAPASGKVARALGTARRTALKPSSPTSGARPGAGRVMNAIMSPVV